MLHVTVAREGPGSADTVAGAVGVPTVTEGLRPDRGRLPAAFPATTVNRYAVPFVSPVTAWVVAVP